MNNQSADFENVMMSTALETLSGPATRLDQRRNLKSRTTVRKGAADILANAGLFIGASMLACIGFVVQWTPIGAESSQIWTHGLIALSLAQCAILAGASFKVFSRVEPNSVAAMRSMPEANFDAGRSGEALSSVVVPVLPAVAVSSGLLGGKVYIAFSDGSIEIDTMLGRRRFEDLGAAREFVGD